MSTSRNNLKLRSEEVIIIPRLEALKNFLTNDTHQPIQLAETDQVIKCIVKTEGKVKPSVSHFILHADLNYSRTPIITKKSVNQINSRARSSKNKTLPVPPVNLQIFGSLCSKRGLSISDVEDCKQEYNFDSDVRPIDGLKYPVHTVPYLNIDPDDAALNALKRAADAISSDKHFPVHQTKIKKLRVSLEKAQNMSKEKKNIPPLSLASATPEAVYWLFTAYLCEVLLFPWHSSKIRPDVAFMKCFMGAQENDSRLCQIEINALIKNFIMSLLSVSPDFVNTQWQNSALVNREIQAGLLGPLLIRTDDLLESCQYLTEGVTQFYLRIVEVFFVAVLQKRQKKDIDSLWFANKLLQDYFCGLPVFIEDRKYGPLKIDRVLALFSEALISKAKPVYKAIWDANVFNLSQKILTFGIDCQVQMLFLVCAESFLPYAYMPVSFVDEYIQVLYPESGMKMKLKNYLAVLPSDSKFYPEALKRDLLERLSYPESDFIPSGTAAALGQFGLCPKPVLSPSVSVVNEPLTDAASPDFMPESYLERYFST